MNIQNNSIFLTKKNIIYLIAKDIIKENINNIKDLFDEPIDYNINQIINSYEEIQNFNKICNHFKNNPNGAEKIFNMYPNINNIFIFENESLENNCFCIKRK